MLETLTIKLKENSKSYEKNNEQRVTRIEVDSTIFNEDTMYQDVTLDTAYSNSIKESFNNMFKGFTPEDLNEALKIKKSA